jgi:hypothetical protein
MGLQEIGPVAPSPLCPIAYRAESMLRTRSEDSFRPWRVDAPRRLAGRTPLSEGGSLRHILALQSVAVPTGTHHVFEVVAPAHAVPRTHAASVSGVRRDYMSLIWGASYPSCSGMMANTTTSIVRAFRSDGALDRRTAPPLPLHACSIIELSISNGYSRRALR